MKLTLACIVGNEEKLIERFIRSFEKVCDELILVRAIGNQKPDQTIEIARTICEEMNLRFIDYDYKNGVIGKNWPHVDNFAAARNLAFDEAAFLGADWIMWADIDDTISEESCVKIRDEAINTDSDVLIVPYEVRGKNQIVMRERLVRPYLAKWVYEVHESMSFNRECKYHVIKDAAIVHAPTSDKVPSKDRNKTILEARIHDLSRNYFYLAQEHLQRREIDAFKHYAQLCVRANDLNSIEKHEMLIQLAQNTSDLNESERYAARAFVLMPDRREALALLSCIAICKREFLRAHFLAKHAMSIPMPGVHYWTLDLPWYTWKGVYLLAQTLRLIDQPEAADKCEDQFLKFEWTLRHYAENAEQALAVRDAILSTAPNPLAIRYEFEFDEANERLATMLKGYRRAKPDGDQDAVIVCDQTNVLQFWSEHK
jgi:glycosyltransferase involved in cell wall biosynthesis